MITTENYRKILEKIDILLRSKGDDQNGTAKVSELKEDSEILSMLGVRPKASTGEIVEALELTFRELFEFSKARGAYVFKRSEIAKPQVWSVQDTPPQKAVFDEEEFKAFSVAFHRLLADRRFVSVADLKAALEWNDQRFNDVTIEYTRLGLVGTKGWTTESNKDSLIYTDPSSKKYYCSGIRWCVTPQNVAYYLNNQDAISDYIKKHPFSRILDIKESLSISSSFARRIVSRLVIEKQILMTAKGDFFVYCMPNDVQLPVDVASALSTTIETTQTNILAAIKALANRNGFVAITDVQEYLKEIDRNMNRSFGSVLLMMASNNIIELQFNPSLKKIEGYAFPRYMVRMSDTKKASAV